jgi:N-acetyl-gamma-glutamyl-phosphate reductase / acetylglutamate kinase
VFGISGYSGAGTKTGSKNTDANGDPVSEPKVTPESLQGGVMPYALTDHIHEREAGVHLSHLLGPGASAAGMKVAFTPVVAPWFSGILSTASVPLRERLRASEVKALYEEKYGGEKLISVLGRTPMLGDVQGKHGFVVGPCQVSSTGDRVVVVVRRSPPSLELGPQC